MALLIAISSCASRSLTIQSTPSGGEVYLDREYVGRTPVTVNFTYGGEREILVYPPPRAPTDTRAWHPRRIIYDTTRDAFDVPVIDLAADLAGAEDRQTVNVPLRESNALELYRIDDKAFRAAMRARENTMRARAREFQLGALPTTQGLDPGPLESRPTTRREPPKPSER